MMSSLKCKEMEFSIMAKRKRKRWKNDIIYFQRFPNLQETGTRKDNGKFDCVASNAKN